MKYCPVAEIAKKWNLSERSVRNYCANGKVPGAYLSGKSWKIPEDAKKPSRANANPPRAKTLLEILKAEKASILSGGIYHYIQVSLTYNSNHMEGSRLSEEQTRRIYETYTIDADGCVPVNDIVETAGHFRCIDRILEEAERPISERFLKELHAILKSGTSDARSGWFAVGDYKRLPNTVGGKETAAPEEVGRKMKQLLSSYNNGREKTLDDLLAFHSTFESIHPFQDGNGRIGRLILFKECLRCGIVPFIIDEELKLYYYRGLREWKNEPGFLRDTCLAAQDKFKKVLDYFRIPY